MLAGLIAVGLSGMFRGKTSEPVADPIAQTGPKSIAQTVPEPVADPIAQTVPKAVTQPVAATTPKSDEERIQGRWKAVEGQTTTKKSSGVKAVSFLWIWTFKGAPPDDRPTARWKGRGKRSWGLFAEPWRRTKVVRLQGQAAEWQRSSLRVFTNSTANFSKSAIRSALIRPRPPTSCGRIHSRSRPAVEDFP